MIIFYWVSFSSFFFASFVTWRLFWKNSITLNFISVMQLFFSFFNLKLYFVRSKLAANSKKMKGKKNDDCMVLYSNPTPHTLQNRLLFYFTIALLRREANFRNSYEAQRKKWDMNLTAFVSLLIRDFRRLIKLTRVNNDDDQDVARYYYEVEIIIACETWSSSSFRNN
jgi:hypothetical protein